MYENMLLLLLITIALSHGFMHSRSLPSSKLFSCQSRLPASSLLAHSYNGLGPSNHHIESTNTVLDTVRKFSSMASMALVTAPMAAMADDGNQNAFLVPLAISLLTMVPFLYYANALQPKERTVRQIEVDPKTLKAVNEKDQKGSTAEARARKK